MSVYIDGNAVANMAYQSTTSYPKVTDPTNALGFGTQAILNGTMYGHLVTGVTRGAGQTLATRQATATALNAAIAYAGANNLRFFIADGIYEISSATGIVVPPNMDKFRWLGSWGVQIIQYLPNSPCFTVGSTTNTQTDTCFGYIIDGVQCQMGVSNSIANTNANMIQIGQSAFSSFLNMGSFCVYSSGLPTNPPYIGIYFTNGSSNLGHVYSCKFDNLKSQGALQDLINFSLPGEGNEWDNIFANAGSGILGTINGAGLNFPNSGGSDETFNKVSLDFIKANNGIINLASQTNMIFNGLHIEECTGNPYSMIAFADCSNIVFNGLHFLNPHNLASEGGSSNLIFFYCYDQETIVINGLTIAWGGPGYVDTDISYVMQDQTGTDPMPKFVINGFVINDPTTGRVQANHIKLLDRNVPTWNVFTSCSKYSFSPIASIIENAEYNGSVTANTTIYGQFKDTNFIVPAALPNNVYITLANTIKASGQGSTLKPPTGSTISFKRQNGTIANNLLIANGNNVVITTNSTNNTFLTYQYNGYDWVTLP